MVKSKQKMQIVLISYLTLLFSLIELITFIDFIFNSLSMVVAQNEYNIGSSLFIGLRAVFIILGILLYRLGILSLILGWILCRIMGTGLLISPIAFLICIIYYKYSPNIYNKYDNPITIYYILTKLSDIIWFSSLLKHLSYPLSKNICIL